MADPTTPSAEGVDRLGRSSRRTAADIDVLAKKLEKSIGAIFTGVPKKLSDLDMLPGTLNRGLAFLEGNLEVLQKFSNYGINFGNELDQMITSAGQANLRLGELASIVQSNSKTFGAIGPNIDAGLQNFLKRQASFFKSGITGIGFETAEQDLRRLGLGALEINERFLQFDKIAAYTNVRNKQTENERNIAAFRFTKSMDRLAKLTGEQADQLAKEQVELSREGDVSARASELSENVVDVYTGAIQEVSKVAPMLGKLTKDMLTAGFPNPKDPDMLTLHSFAGPLSGTLRKLDAALSAGNRELSETLKQQAVQQAIELRNRKDISSLSKVGVVGGVPDTLRRLRTELNNSSMALADDEIRRKIVREKGIKMEEVTSDQIIAKREEMVRKQERAQTAEGEGGQGRKITDLLIESITAAQKSAGVAQQKAVDTLFTNTAQAADLLRQKIKAIDFDAAARDALSGLGGVFGRTGSTLTDAQRLDNYARQLSIAATSAQDEALSRQYSNLAEQAAELAVLSRSGISGFSVEQEASIAAIRDAVKNIQVADIRVRTLQTDVIINRGNQSGGGGGGGGTSESIGSLGTIGRLFKDYGTGTDVRLHNIESVQTPRQVAEVMRASALGTMQALVDELNKGTSSALGAEMRKSLPDIQGATRTSMSSINGMLNTMRTLPQQSAQNPNVIDLSKLEKVMSDLPISIKRPMEEAVSTLKIPLERLLQSMGQQLDVQQKQLKGINGLSNDMLRG